MVEYHHSFGRALTALALAVLCLSAIALVAGVSADTDSHVAIEEDSVEQAHGDVAEFTLSVPQGESVALVVEANGSERQRLTLLDASEDGRITLSINTYLAGSNASAFDVYGVGGDAVLRAETAGEGVRFPPGQYRLSAAANRTASEPADTAALSITEPESANATVMTAPRGEGARLQSVADVERARANGTVTPSDFVVIGDTLVLELQSPGIEGAVANESGRTADDRFRSLLDRRNVSLELAWIYTGPELPDFRFRLDGSSVTTAVADPANDTYYVTADLLTLPYATPDGSFSWQGDGPPLHYGEQLFLEFSVDGDHRLPPVDDHDSNERVGFNLHEGGAAFIGETDADTLEPGLAAAPNQTVYGTTNLAPGSLLTVSATNVTGTVSPLNTTTRVYRGEPYGFDGGYQFEAKFDRLRRAEPGTTINLTVAKNGSAVGFADRIQVPIDSPRADVELSDDALRNGAVDVAGATLPRGGFVVVEFADGGPVVGASEYLDAGTHQRVRVNVRETRRSVSKEYHVFIAHDSDGDESYAPEADRPYADSMAAVGATVSRSTPSNDTETPPDGTATTTVSSTTVAAESPTPTATGTTAGDGSGFGALAALAGLALAGLLVRRRRRTR